MKNIKLNITFHNPNTTEETVAELVKIAAEVAKTKISQTISIHTKQEKEGTMEYREDFSLQSMM